MPLAPEHTTAVFAAELILLLLVGRMLGEGMSRLGQRAIFGQLLAGVVLGPSVFGALVPEIRHVIFPDTPALKSMIDAIAQIGILLLLLLTGMETNLALVKRRRRTVIATSLLGIAVPFACGVGLAYALGGCGSALLFVGQAKGQMRWTFWGTAARFAIVAIGAIGLFGFPDTIDSIALMMAGAYAVQGIIAAAILHPANWRAAASGQAA